MIFISVAIMLILINQHVSAETLPCPSAAGCDADGKPKTRAASNRNVSTFERGRVALDYCYEGGCYDEPSIPYPGVEGWCTSQLDFQAASEFNFEGCSSVTKIKAFMHVRQGDFSVIDDWNVLFRSYGDENGPGAAYSSQVISVSGVSKVLADAGPFFGDYQLFLVTITLNTPVSACNQGWIEIYPDLNNGIYCWVAWATQQGFCEDNSQTYQYGYTFDGTGSISAFAFVCEPECSEQDLFNNLVQTVANVNDIGDQSHVKFDSIWTMTYPNPSLVRRVGRDSAYCQDGCLYFSNQGKPSSFTHDHTASITVDFVQSANSFFIQMTMFVGTNHFTSNGTLNILLDDEVQVFTIRAARGFDGIPENGGPITITTPYFTEGAPFSGQHKLTLQAISESTANDGRVDVFISDFKIQVGDCPYTPTK